MQQGSSLALPQSAAIISHERKVIISSALGSATAMCRGIESIVQLSLNEGHASMDDVECIFSLVNDLKARLENVHSEINS